MLRFCTPTAINIHAVTTFGVSAKETASPIGKFGTGLKYAIAGILRGGGEIHIVSGTDSYDFGTQSDLVRGKHFSFVTMSHNGGDTVRLGFTTELGSHWESWMFYRELYSNTLDENGTVEVESCEILPSKCDGTSIFVDGLDGIHADSSKYFLPHNVAPVYEDTSVKVYANPSVAGIYYRGILAHVFDESETSLFTYDMQVGLLSEDRTLKDMWGVRTNITYLLAAVASFGDSFKLLTASTDVYEHSFDWSYVTPGQHFIDAVRNMRKKGVSLRQDAFARVSKLAPKSFLPSTVQLNRAQKSNWLTATAYIEKKVPAFNPDLRVIFCSELHEGEEFTTIDSQLYFKAGNLLKSKEELVLLIFTAWAQKVCPGYLPTTSGTKWLIQLMLQIPTDEQVETGDEHIVTGDELPF